MIEIPGSLIEAIRTRKAVLFSGLGPSVLAKRPGWDALLGSLVEWVEDPVVKDEVRAMLLAGRRTAAIAALSTKLSDEVFTEVIKDAYPTGAKVPDEVAALVGIPWRGVVTTAWGGLWDKALSADRTDPTRVFQPADAGELAGHRGRFLLHLLGSTKVPDSLCLSPANLRRKVGPTAAAVRALYRRWSFVFIGFELGDPDLVLATERLLGGEASDAEHFLLYPGESGFTADTVAADLGLTPVPFDGPLTGALTALHRAWTAVATEAQPATDDVTGWLAAWARDPSDHLPEAALARAESKLREEKQWEPLLALLLGRAQLRDGRDAKIAEWRAAAAICDGELHDPARAFTTIMPAFRANPDDATLLADVARVARAARVWGDFVVEYTEIAVGLQGAPTAARHWAEIGRIYAAELEQTDNAIGSYQQVLAIEPGHAGALWALRDLLAGRERWTELAPVLAASADAVRGQPDELPLRVELLDLLANKLGDADGALAVCERIHKLDPSAPEVLGELERQYHARERWSELADVLEKKAVLASDPVVAARLRKERADLLAERVGDVGASITTLEASLATDPDIRAPESRATLRQLAALYERAGRDDDTLRTLERLEALAEMAAERIALLRRAAVIWERRSDGIDRAAETYERILTLDGSDPEAFRALTRLHRKSHRWVALADALKRRLTVAPTPAERQELQGSLAKIYEEELGDPARAMDAYAAAGAEGDARESTWEALARLYEEHKRWRPAGQALDRWAELATDPATRAEVLYRGGMLYGEKLDDQPAAQERLNKALEAAPHHLAALVALSTLYRTQGEHQRAAQLMRQTALHTQNRAEKIRLLYEAGTLYEDQLNDAAAATELFRAALAVDPEHVLSAERLVELCTRAGDWATLEPVLDMLARQVDARHPALAADIQGRLGFAAHKLGKLEKAQACYQAAYRLQPDSLPVLAGYAELCFDQQSWAQAAELFGAIIENHREELPPSQLVDVCFRLGRCLSGTGDRRGAIGWYQKALAVERHHRPSIEAMAKLHEEASDWVALLLDKRTLLGLVHGDEKIHLAEEIGDLYAEKMNNPAKAIAAYQSVLALAPQRRHALHKILELYTASQQWPLAAETLVKLAQIDDAPDVRAKYLYAAAVIQRDELSDRAAALTLLNRALDESPELTKAFDAIERVTSETSDWKELARNYRRMIKRLPADGHEDLRLRLWSSLGDLALRHLGDRDLATTALEVASSLEPDNLKRLEQLAELYLEAGPAQLDKAIAHHQKLIIKNPDRLSTYRALAKLYEEAGAGDKRWCVSATLAFLRKADPAAQQFYEQHRPPALRPARRKFTDELWPRLVHADEDPFVSAIFMLLGHFVAATTAQQHQVLGIKRKDRTDVTRDERLPSKVLRYVSLTLDLPPPDLFFSDAEPQGLSMLNLQERGVLTPALLIGQTFAQRISEQDLVFEVGKRMAFLRPERFLRSALPQANALDITLRAAFALGGSPIGSGPHNGEVDRLTDHLRRLVPKAVADQLAVIGRKLQAARGDLIDLEAWMGASDLTAARVGFVLSNDLGAAARMISTEPAGGSPLPVKQRLRDLLAYSVSEDYFAVRKFLGLEVM